jgi:hypothetical protein
MTKSEIRTVLSRDRGLTGNFQIHPRGSLVRTSNGYWGIMERDIPLSHAEMRKAANSAAMLIESDRCGIHLTEIKERLSSIAPEVLSVEDPYAIFSILLADPRFKTSISGYIYLASWEGPRRLSQGDAVLVALRKLKRDGATAFEIAKLTTEILGRPVEKENVYAAIVANGAKFDEETGRWTLHDEDEGDADIDEDAVSNVVASS